MYDVDHVFKYHAPNADQTLAYEEIRQQAKALAEIIAEHAPESRELSLARTKLEEAVMWANASIARNGLRPEAGQ